MCPINVCSKVWVWVEWRKTRGLRADLPHWRKYSHKSHFETLTFISQSSVFYPITFECRLATWRFCRTMMLRGLSPGTSGVTWTVSSPERPPQHGGSLTTPEASNRSCPLTVCLCNRATGTSSMSMMIFFFLNKAWKISVWQLNSYSLKLPSSSLTPCWYCTFMHRYSFQYCCWHLRSLPVFLWL